MILVYAPLAGAVIGVWLVCLVFSRRGLCKQPYLLGAGVVLVVFGLGLALLGLNLQPYVRLRHQPVAAVAVKTLYPVAKTYSVTVQRLDGTRHNTTCIIRGDDWALQGHVERWQWWAFFTGLQHSYIVDRIIGIDHNGQTLTSCSLLPPRPKLDPFLPGGLIRWLIDAAMHSEQPIGQTPLRPLNDGALYRVDIGPNGFVATPQMLSSQMAAMTGTTFR